MCDILVKVKRKTQVYNKQGLAGIQRFHKWPENKDFQGLFVTLIFDEASPFWLKVG